MDACIMPNTTAASELCWETCRCSEGVCACGTPAGISAGEVSWLADTFMPSTQYVSIRPLPLTLTSPRC